MGYALDPDAARGLWGIAGSSTITQPPMYAHAARRLAGWGFRLPAGLVERIERAMEDLWTRRRCADGLLSCFHPWEVADDSPRWDAWSDLPFDRFGTWRDRKLELVAALELDAGDAAVGSTRFAVRSAAFNALVAFNLVELAELTGGARWRERAFELTDALEDCWDPALATWADAADGDPPSGRVRTVDALLPVLVSREAERCDAVWAQLADPGAFAGRFGACGVHRAEPAFDPDAYWRGAAWPQLNYLLWVAARRQGRDEDARRLAAQTRAAALTSGYAEYWNPDTGAGLGAAPQSWTVSGWSWGMAEGAGEERSGRAGRDAAGGANRVRPDAPLSGDRRRRGGGLRRARRRRTPRGPARPGYRRARGAAVGAHGRPAQAGTGVRRSARARGRRARPLQALARDRAAD